MKTARLAALLAALTLAACTPGWAQKDCRHHGGLNAMQPGNSAICNDGAQYFQP